MFLHKTVLLDEAINGLNIKRDGIYVDCTLGGAGHTTLIASQLGEKGMVYAFDQDEEALKNAEANLTSLLAKVTLIRSNFVNLSSCLTKYDVNSVDGILYDLGVSSPQLDVFERGFSYREAAVLDMRMNREQVLSAYNIVNEWSYAELVKIFFRYGEEKFAKSIARRIEAYRAKKVITTTEELVEIIKEAIPQRARRKGGHPAKRTFQALRIAVNDELSVLEQSLHQAIAKLSSGGRLVVITFHSLEDKICKYIFNKYAQSNDNHILKKLPVQDLTKPIVKRITKKPLLPSEAEISLNPRARSAKMRIIEKL